MFTFGAIGPGGAQYQIFEVFLLTSGKNKMVQKNSLVSELCSSSVVSEDLIRCELASLLAFSKALSV